MVHDCGSNNEDDCFSSDVGLEEANFENMTKIHHEQVCFIVGKFLIFYLFSINASFKKSRTTFFITNRVAVAI